MEGRLIAIFSEEALEILYLFTTLEEETAETVALLYKERWHIETDLRSLKEQVRLDTIPARSPGLVACELLMAIACYNLIRALMAEAAKQIGIEPRRLSFSRSRAMFRAFSRAVSHVESEEEFQRRWKNPAPLQSASANCRNATDHPRPGKSGRYVRTSLPERFKKREATKSKWHWAEPPVKNARAKRRLLQGGLRQDPSAPIRFAERLYDLDTETLRHSPRQNPQPLLRLPRPQAHGTRGHSSGNLN